MTIRQYTFLFLALVFCSFCQSPAKDKTVQTTESSADKLITEESIIEVIPEEFSRDQIKKQLQNKITNNQDLLVHVFVPLCDNEHQGIVPVSKSLGDGLSLRTNLYWATRDGMKTLFKKSKEWQLLKSEKNPTADILERVVFYKPFKNKVKVILVADAYRGDRMQACLDDYFNTIANHQLSPMYNHQGVAIENQAADLVAFNGHNGLMDTSSEVPPSKNNFQKDAVVIACASAGYFNEKLKYYNAYPLVTTTNLLYPGAFLMESIINNWATLQEEELIRTRAGDAYNINQKCGQRGARRLFKTGW